MSRPRILIAGIGNIFIGDDAFGCEVAQRLAQTALPADVRVVDYGIRGIDLAYALMDGYESVILVDAVPRGEAPGTLFVIEPELNDDDSAAAVPMIDMHNLDPAKVLQLARAYGGRLQQVLLVGCEPAAIGDAGEPPPSMSESVRSAISAAVELVQSLVEQLLAADRNGPLEARSTQLARR
ncbi:MAG TPA: hydrogenase maturation protease [Lacipirellulaceae bacterium]|nr:hydrogenase maturation protease [Lacipirellulaceae bacterium]